MQGMLSYQLFKKLKQLWDLWAEINACIVSIFFWDEIAVSKLIYLVGIETSLSMLNRTGLTVLKKELDISIFENYGASTLEACINLNICCYFYLATCCCMYFFKKT